MSFLFDLLQSRRVGSGVACLFCRRTYSTRHSEPPVRVCRCTPVKAYHPRCFDRAGLPPTCYTCGQDYQFRALGAWFPVSRYLLTHAYMVPFVLLTRALSSFFHLSEMLLNFNMTCRHVHCFLMATFWWMTLLHYAAILCCGVWWMLIGTPWVGIGVFRRRMFNMYRPFCGLTQTFPDGPNALAVVVFVALLHILFLVMGDNLGFELDVRILIYVPSMLIGMALWQMSTWSARWLLDPFGLDEWFLPQVNFCTGSNAAQTIRATTVSLALNVSVIYLLVDAYKDYYTWKRRTYPHHVREWKYHRSWPNRATVGLVQRCFGL